MNWIELYFQLKVWGMFAGLTLFGIWGLTMLVLLIGSRR